MLKKLTMNIILCMAIENEGAKFFSQSELLSHFRTFRTKLIKKA